MKSNILLLVISLIISLLLGEVLLRVLGYDPAFVNPLNSFHQSDPELGWLGVPDFSARFQKPKFDAQVTANQQGFRKKISSVTPDPEAKTIFFLGDSFTWGWGANNGELFTDRLQTGLGPDYRIENYGVNAYGSAQELLLFKRLLQAGNVPDSLFIMLYSNDFSDNLDRKHLSRPYYAVADGTPVLKNIPVADPIGGWAKNLRRNSYLLTFLSYWINYYQTTRDNQALQAEVINTQRPQPTLSDNSYAVMRHVLKQFKSLCDEYEVRLNVVYIAGAADFASGAPYRQAVSHISASLGIAFVDLTPEFAASPAKYHFAEDEHWNANGHELAAKILRAHIEPR